MLKFLVICCQCVPRASCYYCHAKKCITHAPDITKQQLSGWRVNSWLGRKAPNLPVSHHAP